MKEKFISVILPVYNVEKYVEQCIQSVLTQSYQNFELLIIDDGSTDRTLEICQKYQNDKVVLLKKDHAGVYSARNFGLQFCKGEFIAFIDSDDWIEETYLEVLINGFTDDSIDFTQCGYIRRSEDGKILYKRHREEKIADGNDRIWYEHLATGNINTTLWGKIFRKAQISGTSFQENYGYEDGMFIMDILEHTHRVRIIDKPLYNYRKTPDSITQTNATEKKVRDCLAAAEYEKDKVQNYKPDYVLYAQCAFCSKCIRLYYILTSTNDPKLHFLQETVLDKFSENYRGLKFRDLKCKKQQKAKLYLFRHHRKLTVWLMKTFNL